MIISRNNILSALLCSLVFGYANAQTSNQRPDNKSFDEFQRTTFCTNAGLPMEIQFSLNDNPPRLAVNRLRLDDIDHVIRRLDSRVASILKGAGRSSWAKIDSSKIGSREFSKDLKSAIDADVAKRAPQELNLLFCGKKEDVGTAIVASLTGYFSRSTDLGNGDRPEWVKKLTPTGRTNSVSIVMTAVALRLAGIDFDISKLVSGFDQ